MPVSVDPKYSVAGFLVGLLVGQTDMGGGALMTPVLILLFGVHPATAVGIDLHYASMTKTIGTLVHGLSRTVKWRVVGLLASGSVPAGAIGVTILLLLYPRLPMAIIVGSDIAHAVPLTLVAGVGHWFLGSVDWSLLTSLLTGSVPGVILGSYLAARVPDAVLRPILATTLVLVSGRLVF
jgi:uncharacterized membrane protein YfcA